MVTYSSDRIERVKDRIERVVCNGLYFDMEEELRGSLTKEELGSLRRSPAGLKTHIYGLDMIIKERTEWNVFEKIGSMPSNKEWRERSFTYSFLLYYSFLLEKAMREIGD